MAEYSNLSATINAQIRANGVQAITGPVLNAVLTAMVNVLGDGYRLNGVAVPADNPGSPDNRVAYLAAEDGTYTNFGGLAVSGEVALLLWDSAWTKATLFSIDTAVTPGSGNLVTSGAVDDALTTLANNIAAAYMQLVPAATEGNLAEFDNAGQVRDAGLATSDLATKDGHYPDLFAGFAGNLVDTRSAGTRQGPFAFRQSGGDGVNYMRKILGRTEAFNQLVTDPNFSSTSAWDPSKGSLSVSNNIATFTKDSIEGAAIVDTPCPFINGHTYYVKARVKTSVNALVRLSIAGGTGSGWDVQKELISGTWTTINGLISSAHGPYSDFYITTNSLAENDTMQIKEVKVVDLTLMFGAGNEPATPEAFEALHPLPYYNYNAGVLKNNAATGLETTGFNQWDEVMEFSVGINNTTGQRDTSIVGTNSSPNYIPVLPSTAYYFKSGNASVSQFRIFKYAADQSYLGTEVINVNDTYTTDSETRFLKFQVGATAYGSVYKNDICINISSADFNGIYEPYWKREIVLGLGNIACHDENNNAVVVNGLDGVGSSQDELVVENGWGTKIIKRRGRRAYQAGDESDATLMTDGTNTDYPLATPKVLTLDNPIPALIEVDNLGTEKRLPEDTADNPQGPFECDSNYSVSTANLVRLLNL